jgi:hypothetical protein
MSNPPRIKPVLLNVMGDKEWTLKELTAVTGFTFDGINSVLREMRGQAFICDWQPQRGAVACAIWKLGDGTHTPRPPARYKRYDKNDPVKRDAERLKQPYFTAARLPWELTPCHP